MKFQWKGLRSGNFDHGVIEAVSQDEAIFLLKNEGVIITEIFGDIAQKVPEKEKKQDNQLKNIRAKIKDKELLQFTRKLSAMLGSGLPIVPSLEMLLDQTENKGLKMILQKIMTDVNAGVQISTSLAQFPKNFDPVYVNLIMAGEASGSLETFLEKICINLEKKIKIISDLKSALTYPIILLVVAFGVIIIMMTFVIPVFAEMYQGMGTALPKPTQIVLSISNFVRSKYAVLLVGFIFALFTVFQYMVKKNLSIRLKVDKLMLRLPVFGALIENSSFARIAGILSSLISAGVHLVESIEIAKQSINNEYLKEGLENVKRKVYSGGTLEAILKSEERFPKTFTAFVTVGEKTGKLNSMMASIAKFYEDEFDQSVNRLSQLLEPMMIVFLGITIGFILVAMYLPIFNLGKVVT
jgi:type IV pilus assembly protein PilC